MAENILIAGRRLRYNTVTMKPVRAFACVAVCALSSAGLGFQSPNTADVRPLSGVTHLTIKDYSPQSDGVNWLHGVALCWHDGRLYASFGTNTGEENTCGECLHIRSSDDGGQTWSASSVVASGSSVHGVSHGSLASVDGTLWAFAGAFSNGCSFVHTRAYRRDPAGGWTDCGVVVGGGFWPMQNPIRMANGNWIMGGLRAANGWNASGGNRPAVAISEGDDFTKWNLVVLSRGVMPADEWGEATVDLKKGVLTLTCRPSWGESPMVSHVARSTDGGLTWSALEATECRVVTAKPFTGTLSDGRRYLISTITADGGSRRSPLMIAWSRRKGNGYSFAAAIRTCGSGVSLSYPSAVEHGGKLYVGYSDNGGRTGTNVNSAELAVVPLTALDECEKKPKEDKLIFTASASDDTMVYSGLQDYNYGKYYRIAIGVNAANGNYGRALVRFSNFGQLAGRDLDSISAVLRLCFCGEFAGIQSVDSVTLRAYLMADADAAWTEGSGSNAVASRGDCCWSWLGKDVTQWADGTLSPGKLVEVGSAFVGSALQYADKDAIDIPILSKEGETAIKRWVNGGTNAGFLITGKETPTSDGKRTFDFLCKEDKGSAGGPKLLIYQRNESGLAPCNVTSVADSFFYSGSVWNESDWGSESVLCIGRNNATDVYRGLLRFDLDGRKPVERCAVSNAQLTVTVADTAKKGSGSYRVRLHLLADGNAGWQEGVHNNSQASGTKASEDAGCWNYCCYDTKQWVGGAGVGNDATSAGIDTVASEVLVSAAQLAKGTKIVFPITNKRALRRIDHWLDGDVNAGFLLTTDEAGSSQAAIQIASRENASYAPPTLHIEFTPAKSGLVVMVK